MTRTIGGIVAGAIAWLVVVTAISFIVRAVDPALAAVLNAHVTAAALAERLAIGFVASIIGGAIAARIGGVNAALGAGILLLLVWGVYHVTLIWNQFPVWYHLTFFASLPLLSWLGARFTPPSVRRVAA